MMPDQSEAPIDLLLSRIGQEFDGECRLTEEEARHIAEIIRLCEEALEIAQYRECNSRCVRIPLVGHTEYCNKLRAVLAQIKGQNP